VPLNAKALVSHSAVKFGLFLGGFTFTFKAVNCLLRNLLEEENKLNAFVAGGIAGATVMFLPPADRTPIALYVFIRAAKTAFDVASKRAWFPAWMKQRDWDVALMCISAAQILYGLVVRPQSLPASYLRFLQVAGRKDRRVVSAVGQLARGEHMDMHELHQYAREKRIYADWSSATQKRPMCDIMHPEHSCMHHWASYVVDHFVHYSLRLYIPLNVFTLLVFSRRTAPLDMLRKLFVSCIRSSAFLAFYCGNAWFAQCMLRTLNVYTTKTHWLFGGLAAGPAVLLEHKSRRMELALYCMSPALQGMYKSAVDFGWLPAIPNVTGFMFCLASAVMMAAHQNAPQDMAPIMSKITKNLIGVN
jgi:hypothetical protein